ncbi:MAG: Eco57I restriction-modification methylase domain-containing protein [Chloroflexi bacterium]|nr:Eco57I restriction-modification methylase domain-containing protein [Chloroflexota bacterium]
MPNSDIRQSIHDILRDLRNLDGLKQLFWSELNYERVNDPLPIRGWIDAATNALVENPLLFAASGNREDFHVLYARLNSEKLLLGLERPVISALLNEHPYALFVFSNASQDHWHFVNVKYDTDAKRRKIFRRIVVGPHERLRTATERISMLDVETMQKTLFGLDALAIQTAHDDAFDVEAVTEQFFGYYQVIFAQLQKDLRKQTRDAQWAHDFAQQFLNRLMFLYFIQRKRWLGDDTDFICNFWDTYKKSGAPKDSFYRDWLSVLFFEAFNNQFQAGRSDRKHLPKKFLDALALAPYLNGGLFAGNGLDTKHPVKIGDDIFVALFDRFANQTPGFFERYNFTIREDSPFDQEVAVDPEMIGKVYESLVNVTTEGVETEDQRGNAGIFYTQRIEIDLMCRLALVDYLANHLGEKFKALIYQAVFAYDDADKQAADKALAQVKLWVPINELLRKLTACDPACGSGSFIVGMLMVVDDLQARANKQMEITETVYQRRKRIIGQSLYGVDVKDWAVRTAELRLWLQLIVETDLDAAEMKMQPLLPNLSFKLRVGDSLVQQVGGIIFNVDHAHSVVPAPLKRKLTALKEEKLKFYNDVRSSKFKSEQAVKKEELNIFREILDARKEDLDKRVRELKREIAKPPEQMSLLGMETSKGAEQLNLFMKQKQEDLETAQDELTEVESARTALRTTQDVPFVWDIAFVEIFEDDEKGFGIMVGNPPYVSDENIADPTLAMADLTTENRREYRGKLSEAVAEAYPHFFGYKHGIPKYRKLDGKSDLYIYFYFLGLKQVNPNGSFCFITSNSWLDVGYGKDLQEFLLTQSHVKMILDNQAKRSFKNADVNTIIALLAPPMLAKSSSSGKTARFVMFRTPFENVLSPVIFQEIEKAHERKSTPEYRVSPINQSDLLREDIAQISETTMSSVEKYQGGKWGGKYLRAPDIYLRLMDESKVVVPLGSVANVALGVMSGANDFFYVEVKNWNKSQKTAVCINRVGYEFEMESEFLAPLVKNPRDCDSLWLSEEAIRQHAFVCRKEKAKIRGMFALDYIKWGESVRVNIRQGSQKGDSVKGFHSLPFFNNKRNWWMLANSEQAHIVAVKALNDIHKHAFVDFQTLVDQRFYGLESKTSDNTYLVFAMTSTLWILSKEIVGRANLGAGALDISTWDLRKTLVPNPEFLKRQISNPKAALNKFKGRHWVSVEKEINQPDRRALDDMVFDALKLTRGERDAVYEAVVELVKKRLEKAGSV